MQNVILSVLMNGLMAALLLATMIYCRKLNTRIKVLQDSRSELARIIREFDESTQRATQSIADIHLATSRLSENIQHKIDKANFLADDLQYMIEKGQKMTGKVDPVPVQPVRPSPVPPVAARTQAPPASSAFIMPDEPTEPRARTAQPIAPLPSMQGDQTRRPARARSRAEQEIMSALGAKNNSGE